MVKADHSGLWFSPTECFYSVFETLHIMTLHHGTVHRGSLDHTEMTGSDMLCTSFPGVVLSSGAIGKLWHGKKSWNFLHIYMIGFLLTIVHLQYTSKVYTDNTVEQTCNIDIKTQSFFLHNWRLRRFF